MQCSPTRDISNTNLETARSKASSVRFECFMARSVFPAESVLSLTISHSAFAPLKGSVHAAQLCACASALRACLLAEAPRLHSWSSASTRRAAATASRHRRAGISTFSLFVLTLWSVECFSMSGGADQASTERSVFPRADLDT